MNRTKKEQMLSDWVDFYDNLITKEQDIKNSDDIDFDDMALGFFCAKGATLEEAFDLYHTDCIQLGKF